MPKNLEKIQVDILPPFQGTWMEQSFKCLTQFCYWVENNKLRSINLGAKCHLSFYPKKGRGLNSPCFGRSIQTLSRHSFLIPSSSRRMAAQFRWQVGRGRPWLINYPMNIIDEISDQRLLLCRCCSQTDSPSYWLKIESHGIRYKRSTVGPWISPHI